VICKKRGTTFLKRIAKYKENPEKWNSIHLNPEKLIFKKSPPIFINY